MDEHTAGNRNRKTKTTNEHEWTRIFLQEAEPRMHQESAQPAEILTDSSADGHGF